MRVCENGELVKTIKVCASRLPHTGRRKRVKEKEKIKNKNKQEKRINVQMLLSVGPGQITRIYVLGNQHK